MCTVLLPPGDNPIAVNKYIISYHIISYHIISISDIDDGVLRSKYLHNVKKPFADKCSNTIEGSGVCQSQLLESAR